MAKLIQKKVKASAQCASFFIEVNATFVPRGLTTEEADDVKRKLKNNLTTAISTLPFAHIYPCEVRLK